MTKERMEEYINDVFWQEAKSYAKTAPHEYTIRWWRKDLDQTFCDIVTFIRENGVKERFFSKTFVYLYMDDGYKYWTMGDPMETTYVLNRAEA